MLEAEGEAGIGELPERIAALPEGARRLVERLFRVVASEGEIVPPPEMYPWLAGAFGSVERALRQRVVRVMNRWTFEGATFNPLRALRPGGGAGVPSAAADAALRERIEAAAGDDFCDPERRTPADVFGRVAGAHVTTASNVAKADGWHALGVFRRHDPLAIDAALVADVLAVAEEWARRARARDPEARHLFTFWNCLPRAGASLIHGHVQMILSREMPQARVELWRAAAERYRRETGGDYFADLAAAHRALGLAADLDGAARFALLSPAKEREVALLAPPAAQPFGLGALAAPLAGTLAAMIGSMGVRAFNVAVFGPPPGVAAAGWSGFPLVARIVDRGDPLSPTSDVAAMELFGSSVVASDPFAVARALRNPSPRPPRRGEGAGWAAESGR